MPTTPTDRALWRPSARPFPGRQNSGGGATVCLSATGSGSDMRLSWTVSASVSGLQVYRSDVISAIVSAAR